MKVLIENNRVEEVYSDACPDIPVAAIEYSQAEIDKMIAAGHPYYVWDESGGVVTLNQSRLDAYVASLSNVRQISKLEMYYQAKAENLWTTFQAILDADADAKAEWELASYLDITRPTVQAIGTAMGMDTAGLQTFFNNAKGRVS